MTETTHTAAEMLAWGKDTLAKLRADLAAAEAETRDDVILAWDYGMGVKWKGAMPAICDPWEADPYSMETYRPVRNGDGAYAALTNRQDVVRETIANLRRCIGDLEKGVEAWTAKVAEEAGA